MNKKSELKSFIHEFDFENPNWINLPHDFPSVDTSSLTRYEKGMLTSIKLAWSISQPKFHYTKKALNFGLNSASLLTLVTLVVMFVYYINVEYKLGLTFLTEFFA